MMNKTDIANLALNTLRVSTYISDLETDNSVEARVIRRFFKMALDYVTAFHPWTFATTTVELVKKEDNPDKEFHYSYYIPSDSILIRQAQEKITSMSFHISRRDL